MNPRILAKLRQYGRLARAGDFAAASVDIRRWIWSDVINVCLGRDLSQNYEPPKARVEFEIQPLTQEMADAVFVREGLDAEGVRALEDRIRMWGLRFSTAYVAVSTDGHPLYIQWAISGSEADKVEHHYGSAFPHLQPNELFLENAWVTPCARGQGIMAEAMSRITKIAAGPDHSRAITVVRADNEPSIRGCRSAGFEVYMERKKLWRFGHLSLVERMVVEAP